MTRVKILCPSCGSVEVRGHEVHVVAAACHTQLSRLHATCPVCLDPICTMPTDQQINMLIANGIRVETFEFPAELDEPHHGAVIAYDDVTEFVLHLGVRDHLSTVASLKMQP